VQINHQLSTWVIKAAITILHAHHGENLATWSPYLLSLTLEARRGLAGWKGKEIMEKGRRISKGESQEEMDWRFPSENCKKALQNSAQPPHPSGHP
jgi:hypothetical protein